MVCARAAGGYRQVGSSSAFAQGMALVTLFILASLPSCYAWLAFGATAQRLLRTERARRAVNAAMGVLLAGSVVRVVR